MRTPLRSHQYSCFFWPGCGCGYIPSASGITGAGESSVVFIHRVGSASPPEGLRPRVYSRHNTQNGRNVAKGKQVAFEAAELQKLDEIKKLVIVAMFSDDELMDRLVLKGGNAMDLIHEMSARASVNVDFSMEDDFPAAEREAYHGRVERALKSTFQLAGYVAFDVQMEERPKDIAACR